MGGTILLSVASAGTVAMAVNLARSLIRTGAERFLIIALDIGAHEDLYAHGIPTLLARPDWLDSRGADLANSDIARAAEDMSSAKRTTVLNRVKHNIVRSFLIQGFTVYFHDVGTAYAGRGVVDEIEEWVRGRRCALAFLTDAILLDMPWRGWGTGLFIARPRWSTIQLLDRAARVERGLPMVSLAEQDTKHRPMRHPCRYSIRETGEKVICSIPSGKKWSTGIWACSLNGPLPKARLVHASWAGGNEGKVRCLAQHGMWSLHGAALPRAGQQFEQLRREFLRLPVHGECFSAAPLDDSHASRDDASSPLSSSK